MAQPAHVARRRSAHDHRSPAACDLHVSAALPSRGTSLPTGTRRPGVHCSSVAHCSSVCVRPSALESSESAVSSLIGSWSDAAHAHLGATAACKKTFRIGTSTSTPLVQCGEIPYVGECGQVEHKPRRGRRGKSGACLSNAELVCSGTQLLARRMCRGRSDARGAGGLGRRCVRTSLSRQRAD